MNEMDVLAAISQKLSVLISLQMSRNGKKPNVGDGIATLSPFGLSNSEIASICGTKRETVEQVKSRMRSKKR